MIQNVKKILAPIDFSEYSMEALRGAMELVKDVGGELHIVHVVAPHFSLFDKMRRRGLRAEVELQQSRIFGGERACHGDGQRGTQ